MKTIFTAALSLLLIGNIAAQQKEINTTESRISWTGKKVTGSHEGLIDFKSGTLYFQDGVLSGGVFTVDMTTLVVTDLDGEAAQNLEGHLKSDDFFGVSDHPTSVLKIDEVLPQESANEYLVKGDMEIKGHSEPIDFMVTMYEGKASAELKIDRTKYDIRYGSGKFFDNLGDKTIYDDFLLSVELVY